MYEEFLLDRFCLSTFEYVIPLFSGFCYFWWKLNHYLIHCFVYVTYHFSLAAFNLFSLALAFCSVVIMCLHVISFGLILFGVEWTSWRYKLMFFLKFEKLIAIIYADLFSWIFMLIVVIWIHFNIPSDPYYLFKLWNQLHFSFKINFLNYG